LRAYEKDVEKKPESFLKTDQVVSILQTYFDRFQQELSECKPGDDEAYMHALMMLHQVSTLFGIQTEINRNMRENLTKVCEQTWASVPSEAAFHFWFD